MNSRNNPFYTDEIHRKVLDLFPNAIIDENAEGRVVIDTSLVDTAWIADERRVFARAHALLEKGQCFANLAEDQNGNLVDYRSIHCAKVCAYGAIDRAIWELEGEALGEDCDMSEFRGIYLTDLRSRCQAMMEEAVLRHPLEPNLLPVTFNEKYPASMRAIFAQLAKGE